MPAWYWIVVVALAFVATIQLAVSAAYDVDWPGKMWFFLALICGSWAIVLAAFGGLVVLLS